MVGALAALLPLASCSAAASQQPVFSAFAYGAVGDGKANDTAAIQRTIDAAGGGQRGVAQLPGNGTFLLGGGLNLIGHGYDGVTLQIDGAVTVPGPAAKPGWPTPAQCGLSTNRPGANLIPRSLCSVLLVINVDRFTFTGSGTVTGFLFDEHSGPQPAGGGGFVFTNVTNPIVENLRLSHFDGMMYIHFSQNITVRNVSMFNRNTPEETGDIEIGGMGSHGVPPPLCAWKGGRFHPDDPCLVPGANWQYELPLLRPRNFTMRDSLVNGGDDNVCISARSAAPPSPLPLPPPLSKRPSRAATAATAPRAPRFRSPVSSDTRCVQRTIRLTCWSRTSTSLTATARASAASRTATAATDTSPTLSTATALSGATRR